MKHTARKLLAMLLCAAMLIAPFGVQAEGLLESIKNLFNSAAQNSETPPAAAAGDVITWGHYEQDNNPSNGAEPIEWIVLEVQDGKAFVVSRQALNCVPYNAEDAAVTWETCSLRTWLNSSFLQDAFTPQEEAAILTSYVDNSSSQGMYSTNGGNTTLDKIYLLSYAEAWKYFTTNSTRQCFPTEYSLAQGSFQNPSYDGACWWWLRSPGNKSNRAMAVSVTGKDYDYYVTGGSGASVRPVMWLKLDGTADVPVAPDAPVQTIDAQVGGTITWGHYEQDNNQSNGAEPIEWIVLEVRDGKALIVSRYGLETMAYNTESVSVTWDQSSLKRWLNQEFITAAFAAGEQANIAPDSGAGRVFVLSVSEAESYLPDAERRACAPTAYAAANGAWTSPSRSDSAGKAFGCPWLRDTSGRQASRVRADGTTNGTDDVADTSNIVRPAMWLDLSVTANVPATPDVPVQSLDVKAGDVIKWGHYEQDNDKSNGAEPIEWKVLDVKGDQALVVSLYGLDCVQYNKSSFDGNAWETSDIRSWLNGTFLNEAFTASERESIQLTDVNNSAAQANPEYLTNGGGNTQDRIFLLSYAETVRYFPQEGDRVCMGTAYANANGSWLSSDRVWWWTRSPGDKNSTVAIVFFPGKFLANTVSRDDATVRPAMWLKLSAAADAPAAPAKTIDAKVGDVITWGHYEQDNNKSNGAEPIEWLIVAVQNGKALAVSRYGLEARAFNEGSGAVSWNGSSLRKWLNEEFLSAAFTAEERALIAADAGPGQIFVLNRAEAEQYLSQEERATTPTAVAIAQGAWVSNQYAKPDRSPIGCAWLRNTQNTSAYRIAANGTGDGTDVMTDKTNIVRPVMWLDLGASSL